jgi:hypothetical protein
MKRLLVAAIALVPLLPLGATPIEADLGEGLRYHRAHVLPAELPAPDPRTGMLLLDLRYATADAAAATALDGWIKFRASADTPVTVLVNPGTAPVLHSVFAANQAQPGFVTIGTAHADYSPDIVVTTSPEAERRAYDVLENNGSITALLTENTAKLRHDEASMMRERRQSAEPILDEGFDELSSPEAPKEDPSAATPPPVDVALQRAVHLHRALRALKRIP